MLNESHYFKLLVDMLPTYGWYIAGGSLSEGHANDIDIFFYSESDYLAAKSSITGKPHRVSDYADTYAFTDLMEYQLIKTNFGDPLDVMSEFDLNKSRQALLPDGTIIQHPTYHQDLYFDTSKFRYNTFSRIYKYMHIKGYTLDIHKFKSNVASLLATPDVSFGHYYLDTKQLISKNIYELLCSLLTDNILNFGWLLPIFESLPAEQRLALYQEIIKPETEISILPSMSHELQAILSLNEGAYLRYQYWSIGPGLRDGELEMFKLYPPQTPSFDVTSVYPELFI